MSMSEKIKIILIKKDISSEAELARRLGIAPQTLNKKFKRDNFTENDLQEIAKVLDCKLKISFVINDTGEEV